MRYFIDFLFHFVNSNSRHGTHSPFVYNLADKAIYRKVPAPDTPIHFPADICPRCRPVLTRILNELNIFRMTESLSAASFQTAVFAAAEEIKEGAIVVEMLRHVPLVVIQDIYRSAETKQNWKKVQAEPDVTITIDLFYFGLAFKKEGQYKENFCLRYPFWIK